MEDEYLYQQHKRRRTVCHTGSCSWHNNNEDQQTQIEESHQAADRRYAASLMASAAYENGYHHAFPSGLDQRYDCHGQSDNSYQNHQGVASACSSYYPPSAIHGAYAHGGSHHHFGYYYGHCPCCCYHYHHNQVVFPNLWPPEYPTALPGGPNGPEGLPLGYYYYQNGGGGPGPHYYYPYFYNVVWHFVHCREYLVVSVEPSAGGLHQDNNEDSSIEEYATLVGIHIIPSEDSKEQS